MNFVKHHIGLIQKAITSWVGDGGNLMAAAVAYYAGLSFFPLLLVLVASFGFFLEMTNAGVSARDEIVAAIGSQFSQSLADQVGAVLEAVSAEAPSNSVVGWVALIFSAAAIFVQFDAAFDRIWGNSEANSQGWLKSIQTFLFGRLTAFAMLSGLGVLVIAVSASSLIIATLKQYLPLPDIFWNMITALIPICVNLLAFTLIYRIVPKVRVHWREAFRGAVFATLMWEIGRTALAAFLLNGQYASAYRVIGSFIAVLLWVYYAAAVVFLGAEYIRAFCSDCALPADQKSQLSRWLYARSSVADTDEREVESES